jgi:hypothetical protein
VCPCASQSLSIRLVSFHLIFPSLRHPVHHFIHAICPVIRRRDFRMHQLSGILSHRCIMYLSSVGQSFTFASTDFVSMRWIGADESVDRWTDRLKSGWYENPSIYPSSASLRITHALLSSNLPIHPW